MKKKTIIFSGHAAERNTRHGSIFVRAIYEVFKKHAINTHITDLFTKVRDQSLSTYAQNWGRGRGFKRYAYVDV